MCNEPSALNVNGMNGPEQKLKAQQEALHALTNATQQLTNAQRTATTATEARDDAIREAMNAGLTYADIGTITGLTSARIGQIKNHTR